MFHTHDDEDGQRLRLGMILASGDRGNDHSPSEVICQMRRLEGNVKENLRKTARGASSPAKPALHIPDLGTPSARPSIAPIYLLLDGIDCSWRMERSVNSYPFDPRPPKLCGVEAYPLSMTRAATSSVDRQTCQQVSMIVENNAQKRQARRGAVEWSSLPSMVADYDKA